MEFTNIPPQWDAEGAEPTSDLKKNGFKAGYKPPASYFNYLFHKFTECIKELQKVAKANERKYCLVGSDTANSNGWYKVASQTLASYKNTNITFLVTSTYANYHSGIYQLQIRSNSVDSLTVFVNKWLARIGFPENAMRIVIDGMTWTLYVNQKTPQYGRIIFDVLSDSTISGVNSGVTLYNSNTPEETEPDATNSSIDGGTVKNAAFATMAEKDSEGNVIVDTYAIAKETPRRVNLTAKVQATSYMRSVIALCKISEKNKSSGTYSTGRLSLVRDNGAIRPVAFDISIIDEYYQEYKVDASILGYGTNKTNIRPCTFTYEGVKYGGVEVYINVANCQYVNFCGLTNFNIFGLDYYNSNTGEVLNQEVYDSLNFDCVYDTCIPLYNNEQILVDGDVVDDLTNTSATAPLSANMGKYLEEKKADVETGTWTPTVMNANTAVTTGISTASGTYEKIGNKVFIECYVAFNSATTVSHIKGLPIAPKKALGGYKSGSLNATKNQSEVKTPFIMSNYIDMDIEAYESIYISGYYTVS